MGCLDRKGSRCGGTLEVPGEDALRRVFYLLILLGYPLSLRHFLTMRQA